ncbi:terpene cyclase/mutase family protein [Melghirimyces algeriensis]|uniref:Sporulenol synthase n=1 Tax=Melghirimyces algeriensis TaxID=910412 RepID=A0A521ARH8_9BACL|nr:prenyltransferase/squalene oxidase repeat-containing protein [Melghirimyces algeriensis]SMO37417.1 sporulenol synthase [Melghirimyces algeriensis]
MHKPEQIRGVSQAIDHLVQELIEKQQKDGRWTFCFESGPMTDSYMLLLYEILGLGKSEIREGLAERILSLSDQGVWKLYSDEKDGNVSATMESSLALVATGFKDPSDPVIKKSQNFVREQGGIDAMGSLTKVMLTLTGYNGWPHHAQVPVKIFLLPWWFPISFFDFVGFTRVHVAPILLASHREFTLKLPRGPVDATAWTGTRPEEVKRKEPLRDLEQKIHQLLPHATVNGNDLSRLAEKRGLRFILTRRESDGTLYSYFSSTFLMVFGLMALGYPRNHPVIVQAINGLEHFLMPVKGGLHLQETTSTVWDTALISYALQEAGVSAQHPAIQKGVRYLLSRQHVRYGDWALRNPGESPGGWGFSDINTMNPDLDDTSYSLRALGPSTRMDYQIFESWNRGGRWALSMQNRDGGWSAFEKNTDKKWPKVLLPATDARTVWTDPSTNDLTGRMLEWIGNHLGWKQGHPVVDRAVRFLLRNQESDGSWFGRWGIAYIYGTWAALTGLTAVELKHRDDSIRRGVDWLLSIQNKDGGWGESCESDVQRKYIPLNRSILVQTAWAVDALVAVYDRPVPALEAGVFRLLEMVKNMDSLEKYPTGGGLAGQFYIYYHSYPYIWPLVALSHYQKKFGKVEN